MTKEEYLRIERTAEVKSEFYNGEMFAMAGGSPTHALLAANIVWLLRSKVTAGCRVFSSDLRVEITAAGTYTYPDCTVVCGGLELSGEQRENVLNPKLIVEVLSPATESYDRGKKFELYRSIESFEEYLIIHQDRPFLEHYSRQDEGGWLLRVHSGEGAVVMIHRLGIQIPLADLYEGAFVD